MNKDQSKRYKTSEEYHLRAIKTIPLGSQTFSKSKTQFPWGISPYFMARAKGSHTWDVDGNEYIDFINSLASVSLGYNDPDVTKAVQEQLQIGTIFSLPHELEFKVAEKLVAIVPSAEMVRFGKNGSDATSGAIRLSRAFTKRDRVAVCGYHGWQDWYIGATARNRGVPQSVRELTHTFSYNDIDSLAKLFREYPGEFAAVIMEPMNVVPPQNAFLENVGELTRKHGAVFVFDETITGFRYANGGAQELFGVIPDLTTLGKGMANGYPVSAIVGKAEIMHLMEEIFFSFTFGGELLSLAAALATLEKIQREPVVKTLRSQGKKLCTAVNAQIEKYEINDIFHLSGDPTWSFLNFKDAGPYKALEIKTLFMQEALQRGVLAMGSHNMSYAHSDADLETLFLTYDEVFPILREAVFKEKLPSMLRAKPLEMLFKVR